MTTQKLILMLFLLIGSFITFNWIGSVIKEQADATAIAIRKVNKAA